MDNIYAINDIERGCAVTVGMFDGVHLGHRHILDLLQRQARERGLVPVVVTFDRHPRVVLGSDAEHFRTLSALQGRRTGGHSIAATDAYEVVLPFDHELARLSACQFVRSYLVERMNMRLLVLGYDNVFGNRAANDFDLLPRLAGELGFGIVEDTAVEWDGAAVSSTRIRRALAEGDMAGANAMLGRAYTVEGTVVEGRHVGRRLGFPTANLQPCDPLQALPREGVYAARAVVDGTAWTAMASLGPQPTFGCDAPTLEVHLLGSPGDLYGRRMQLSFVHRMRDIVRFDSPDALAAQLAEDSRQARALLQRPDGGKGDVRP